MFLYTTKPNAGIYLVCDIKEGNQSTTITKIYVLSAAYLTGIYLLEVKFYYA